jgi:putative ABC transport system permease protein
VGLGLAIALGVAAFVGVLSMSAAADAQVAQRIAALRPELVTLRPLTGSEEPSDNLNDQALESIASQPGLVNAAVTHTYRDVTVRARWGTDEEQVQPAPVIGVEGELIGATRSQVDGQDFDGVDSQGEAHVALVGHGLADRIGLSAPELEPTIWIDGVPFRAVGVVVESKYLSALTDTVVIPRRTALQMFVDTEIESVGYVRVERGMADLAAEALPLRLTPQRPEMWAVEVPRVPLDVAEGISTDLKNLSLGMAGLVMFIGVVAIANAMMRSVYERMPEIGLRRSLGARATHVLGLLVTEAAQIGLVAGVLGVTAGLLVSVGVAVRNDWPITVSLIAILAAVPAGVLAGAAGGLFPALTAVRVTPSQALRRE